MMQYKNTTFHKYCTEHKLPYATILYRVRKLKMSIEDAICTPNFKHCPNNTKMYFRGFPLVQWAKKLKQNPYTVRNRIKNGMTVEQALTKRTQKYTDFLTRSSASKL